MSDHEEDVAGGATRRSTRVTRGVAPERLTYGPPNPRNPGPQPVRRDMPPLTNPAGVSNYHYYSAPGVPHSSTSSSAASVNSRRSCRSTESVRRQRVLELQLEEEERLAALERKQEEQEMERKARLERQEMERQRQEMERLAQMERRELDRQKLLGAKRMALEMSKIEEDDFSDNSSQKLSDVEDEPEGGNPPLGPIFRSRSVSPNDSNYQREYHPSSFEAAMTTMAKAVETMALNVGKPKDQASSSTNDKYQARKLAKDLNPFYGDPENWSMFIAEFERTTKMCGYSSTENVSRLQKCLKGKALLAVKDLLINPENVTDVISTLKERFGRPELVVKMLIEKAKKLPPVRDGKPEALSEFSDAVRNIVAEMTNSKYMGHMTNPQLLEDLVSKLSSQLQFSWAMRVAELANTPDLESFSTWLKKVASAVLKVGISKVTGESSRQEEKDKGRSSRALTATDRRPDRGDKTKKRNDDCICCKNPGHHVTKCREFVKLSTQARWQAIRRKGVCFQCLRPGHRSPECRSEKCGTDGCNSSHHALLHQPPRELPPANAPPPVEGNFAVNQGESDEALQSVIPVTVIGPEGEYGTYALLDTGSTRTLIDRTIAGKIGLRGPREPLKLFGISSTPKFDQESCRVTVKIKGENEEEVFSMDNVRTVKNLNLHSQSVNPQELSRKWSHLGAIPMEAMKNAKPMILIGQDNYELFVAREVVEGDAGGPILTKTKLGWVIQGNTGTSNPSSGICYNICSSDDDMLHQLVKESFLTESFGVKIMQEPKRSVEDRRALDLMDRYTRQVTPEDKMITKSDDWMLDPRVGATNHKLQTARWMAPLPWKDDTLELPESRSLAFKRLKMVEKKMDEDPEFGKEYCQKIQLYLDKGFARKLSPEEAAVDGPRTWYLPHFAVFNPNKPGKWRLVFDAASKSQGTRLNDALIQGPDLLNPLPVVLFKFRQKAIAITGDVRDFFHRVWIRPEDQDAQRFLWRGLDRDRPPDVLQMSVMVFGAVSSPFCAQYVRNRNAKRFEEEYPEAVDGIVKKHYVDDYLDCTDTEEQAVKLIDEVRMIHRHGGFEIVGWTSSSKEVLKHLPEDAKAGGQKDLEPDSSLPMARVLGLHWDPNQDVFTFSCKFNSINDVILSGAEKPTKREMLKLVMSVFDPLGFLALFTIKAKIILQEVWRSAVGWDEQIDDAIFVKWNAWLDELKRIPTMKIPRCYSVNIQEADNIQLHLFCDASVKAFAAVGYLRVKKGDLIEISFVTAKTRVAPLKSISVPRLELQAAVMASRLSTTVKEGHSLKIDEVHYWSDSKTVLYWVRSDSCNYKPFVAHRIGEIQEVSEVANWHWVPTAENVADEATRDKNPCEFGPGSRWIKGPGFLQLPKSEWPKEKGKIGLDEVREEDLELKTDAICYAMFSKPMVPDVSKFSSFLKLLRVTAWMVRFVNKKFPKTTPTNACSWELWRAPVTQCLGGEALRRSERIKTTKATDKKCAELLPHELEEAEKVLWRQCQWESFPEEMHSLSKGKPLEKSSRLVNLSPYLDDGVMRLRGRTDQGHMISNDAKRPVILDPKHPFTRLLMQYYHEGANHSGQELVLNELRQRYWILNMRSALRSTWNACVECKVRRCKPVPPEMGQLPDFRLERAARPFAVTGLDYFGPMEVKVGRRREKRYGALFTCMTTRAVHLELADSLTTDSAIMAIRRFIVKRGCPAKLLSDNGTNFHGADNEMKKAIREIDSEKIQAEFSAKGMEWKFIPPSAPHMGGCWERLVQSVKKALKATLKEVVPREEVLRTLLAEAEGIVNSRPLTHVSVDPDDPESLTPNHFLIGSSNVQPAPGEFGEMDICMRKQWRISQRLADRFWRRWVLEYLPTLTKRTKWFKRTGPVKIGDLVFIADGNLPRNQWPRGLVVDTHPGKDGQVRVAEVKTQFGLLTRPVVKLCVLDILTKGVDSSLDSSTGGGMSSSSTGKPN